MENSEVFDNNELKIGEIVDFTFNKEFKLVNFIVKGSNNEHLMQILDIEDNTEFFFLLPQDKIMRFDEDSIHLNIQVKELELIYNIEDIEDKLFSEVNYTPVIDLTNKYVGHVHDVIFHKDDYFSIILGGSYFKELLNRVGIAEDLNLILPVSYIEGWKKNKIVINQPKQSLEKTLSGMKLMKDPDQIKHQKLDSKDAKLMLDDQYYKYTAYR